MFDQWMGQCWHRVLRVGVATPLLASSPAAGQQRDTFHDFPSIPWASSTVIAPQTVVAFVDVNVIPMDTDRVLPHQTVVVQQGRITALGRAGQVVVPKGATRVDGQGKYLLPGLADMHTHISRYGPLAIDRAFFLLLANGVTTIRDMEFLAKSPFAELRTGPVYHPYSFSLQQVQIDGPAMLRLREEIRAGRRWGPQMYLASAWWRDSTQNFEANLRAYQAAGYDFVKVYSGHPPRRLRDSLITTALRLGIPLAGHGERNDLVASRPIPYRSFEHLVPYPWGNGANDPDTLHLPEFIARTVREGVWNCPTLGMIGTVPGSIEAHYSVLEERLEEGYEPSPAFVRMATQLTPGPADTTTIAYRGVQHVVKALQDAGAGLLLGTDAPFQPLAFSVPRELQAFVLAGLTPYQALLTGTRNVAAYFGTLDSAGTVAVGKRADLLLVDGNPLADIKNAGQVAGVMADGRWLSRAAIEARLLEYYREVLKPLPPQP